MWKYIVKNNDENFEIIAVGLCTALALATVDPGDFVLRAILPDFLVSGETTVGLGTTQPTIAGAGETTTTTSGAVSAGPSRILSIYYVSDGSAGSITIKDGGSSGTSMAVFDVGVGGTSAGEPVTYQIDLEHPQ